MEKLHFKSFKKLTTQVKTMLCLKEAKQNTCRTLKLELLKKVAGAMYFKCPFIFCR